MGHVEERRSASGTCVHDLKHRLQKAVEIHHEPRVAEQLKGFVALVPPAVRRAARQRNGLAGASSDEPPVDHRGEYAGSDVPLLILREVPMERGALAMRRERRIQLEPDLVASAKASHL